jgi:hypothetical protein
MFVVSFLKRQQTLFAYNRHCLIIDRYRSAKWWFTVDSTSGETKYQYKDLTRGAAIYAQGHLYCLDESGTMALLEPGEQSLKEVSRFKLLADPIKDAWAHPILCSARLIFATMINFGVST